MDSGDNCTTDISNCLYIYNVKVKYWSTNKPNYIRLILKYNNRYTGFHYMEVTLLYVALWGSYEIEFTTHVNLLSNMNSW